MTEMAVQLPYPVILEVDYPERQSRWKTLLRVFLVIPLVIFLFLLDNTISVAIWAAILVKGRIPRWLFDFQIAFNRWSLRLASYSLLLTDEYPPFEGGYPIRYDVQYPERVSRWRLVIWKFITSIPHFIVLFVLSLTLVVVVPIAWFAILITGRFPQGLHGYVAGILRWGARVDAYAYSLTDEFPPFSLSPDAGSGGQDSYVISSVIGVLVVAAAIAGVVTLAILAQGERVVAEVSYQDLLAGEAGPADTSVTVGDVTVELAAAADPGDGLVPFLTAEQNHRLVVFELSIENDKSRDLKVRNISFRLEDDEGDGHDVFLAIVGGRIPPVDIEEGDSAFADLVFELPVGVEPAELRYRTTGGLDPDDPDGLGSETIVYEFR